jgi:hypothetical protein
MAPVTTSGTAMATVTNDPSINHYRQKAWDH